MSGYGLQAQEEMWDSIAAQDRRPTTAGILRERETWRAIEQGEAPPSANGHLYRAMPARFAGRADCCTRRVRRGEAIRYASLAPRGFKVIHEGCWR